MAPATLSPHGSGRGRAHRPRIDQYLTDLNAYRNDASLSVWQPYGVSGATWEAFTCLWRGDARTLDALCDRLSFRGHPHDDYAGRGPVIWWREAWIAAGHDEPHQATDGGPGHPGAS